LSLYKNENIMSVKNAPIQIQGSGLISRLSEAR
jgi:hypothetical protein